MKIVNNLGKKLITPILFRTFVPMRNEFNIAFNEAKTVNAVLFILGKISRKDFHKIFKVLYFADRNLFADFGKTITGDHYIAMNAGPVPSNLYDIFKSLRGSGYFKDNGTFSKFFKVVDNNFIEAQAEPNLNALSKIDIQYLNQALEEYGEMDYWELKRISHDYAWDNTVRDDIMSFENILLEKGEHEEYICFLKDRARTHNTLRDAAC